MFNLEKFIENCVAAQTGSDNQKAIREILSEAMAMPNEVLNSLGEPREAGVEKLHHSEELTILNVIWGIRHFRRANSPNSVL